MPLSDEQVKEIARRVIEGLNPRNDPASDSSDGEIVLLDESAGREARIASRLATSLLRRAVIFDTKEELEKYLDEHPGADRSKHSVKPSSPDSRGEQPQSEAPSGKQPQPEQKSKKRQKPEHEVSLEGVVEDPQNWETHRLHERQLSPGVVIRFPGGESKKYGDLTDDEKQRVKDAISSGKAASKGLNDYSDRSLKTVKGNMARNLARYEDPDVQEKKNTDKSPVTKDNAENFSKSLLDNAHSVLDKYTSSMSKVSRPMMEKHIERVVGAIYESVNDGSLGNVAQSDLDEYVREDLKRMIHQEIETRRRALGDHGIRHSVGNAESSLTMLEELQKSGIPVSGRDKLMALSAQANHDTGYTAGDIATDAKSGKQHRKQSEVLMREEMGRYEGVFGKDGAESLAHIVGTHDDNDIDWEEQPVASAVRLADATALFGKEKVQDLFIRSPEAMGLACKMRLAAEADPKNKELQKTIKKGMHDAVDKGDFDDEDKELLHQQVDEMTEDGFSTTADILSRFSGRIKGFSYDSGKKVMSVNMSYSPEGQTVDMLFGDKVAGKQFGKFVKDMGGEPVEGQRGNVEFKSHDKAAFRLNMEGSDDDPIDSATTEQMKDFAGKTARMDLMKARSEILPPPEMVKENVDEAFSFLKRSKSKFTEEEWKEMEALFRDYANEPDYIVEALAHWRLLDSERNYLEGKVARTIKRIVARIIKASFDDISASFSLRGIVFYRRFNVGDESFPAILDASREEGDEFSKDVNRLILTAKIEGRLGTWQHRKDHLGHYIAVRFTPEQGVIAGELSDVLRNMGVRVEGV